MRLAFFGSPTVAANTLTRLVAAGHEIGLVVTQRDRRRGRGGAEVPTAVKQVAVAHGIPVSHRIRDVLDARCELAVVVAFGRIVPADVLVELLMVNLHLSLLPRWRGAAPVERAILAGDEVTGVSLMRLDEGLDTGPVYAVLRAEIDPNESAGSLTLRLGELGTSELLARIQGGLAGLGEPAPQLGEPTYADKLTIEDHHLDFALSAAQCARVVQVGRAFSSFRGKRLIVHRAHVATSGELAQLDATWPERSSTTPGVLVPPFVVCADGALVLEEVQLEGRARQRLSDFANGMHLDIAELLGQSGARQEL